MKTKSHLFVTFFMALSYYATGAESNSVSESYSRPLSLGIQAGLDFETAATPRQISSNTYTGFSAGIAFEIPLTASFSLQPELNYSRRGLNLVDAGGVTANAYYHSLELPVFAKISLGSKIRPYIFAGPMAIANISHSVEGMMGGAAASTSFNPKTMDFAGVVGAGIDLGSLFINARYSVGLININNNSADWYSRGFKLMAGVQI
jgi:opacity protein-like surface antigen